MRYRIIHLNKYCEHSKRCANILKTCANMQIVVCANSVTFKSSKSITVSVVLRISSFYFVFYGTR